MKTQIVLMLIFITLSALLTSAQQRIPSCKSPLSMAIEIKLSQNAHLSEVYLAASLLKLDCLQRKLAHSQLVWDCSQKRITVWLLLHLLMKKAASNSNLFLRVATVW